MFYLSVVDKRGIENYGHHVSLADERQPDGTRVESNYTRGSHTPEEMMMMMGAERELEISHLLVNGSV